MELRQLKYFVKAAELNNFTAASSASFITQSTLSQQIKQLEAELNVQLFDRVGKRVRLTEAGALFLPFALKTIKDAEDGKDIIHDLMNLRTGTLYIGSTYGLTSLLVKAVVDFSKKCPDIKFQIRVGETSELMEQLELGKLDLVLSFQPVQMTRTVVTEKLFSSCLSLIIHSKQPLATRKQITFRQLTGLPLVLPTSRYSIRNYLDGILQKNRIKLNIMMELNEINSILQLVESGRWYSVLMSSTLFDHPNLRAVKLSGEGVIRQATIAWPIGTYRKKAATLMAEYLHKHAADHRL